MKEPDGEGPATHTGPESCVVTREGEGEALTGVRAGRLWSRENQKPVALRRALRGADAVAPSGRPHPRRRQRETPRDPARSKTPSMYGHTSYGNREVPRSSAVEGAADRIGKSKDESR